MSCTSAMALIVRRLQQLLWRECVLSDKKRLDVALVERGLQESRERAKAVIMSGVVYVNNQKADKAGLLCSETDQIEVRGGLRYVSRGGLKLEKALDTFTVDPAGLRAIDIGASTGGFSDCLLQRGVQKIYAVDVGYGQLAWSVRCDPRVICMERTNIRYVTNEQIPEKLDLAVCDVSFISLRLVFPVVYRLLKPDGQMLTLIKPQFEAGREKVGKKGVVREPETHIEVIKTVLSDAKQIGFTVTGLTYSPIKGPEGNIEFLAQLQMHGCEQYPDIAGIVRQAHENARWL